MKRRLQTSRHQWFIFLLCLLAGLIGGPAAAAVESVMEVPATPAALETFKQLHADDPFVVFTDDRAHSVRRNDMVPARWLDDPLHHVGVFLGTAQPGEFYVFQLAVWAHQSGVENLQPHFSGLYDMSEKTFRSFGFRCLNLGGVGADGKRFTNTLDVPEKKLQVLWMGVEVPPDEHQRTVSRNRL